MTYLALKTNLFANQEATLSSLQKSSYKINVLDLTQLDSSESFWDQTLDEILKADRIISL